MVYDFGGIGDGTSGIAKFKLSFGGKCIEENNYIFGGDLGRIPYIAYCYMHKLNVWSKQLGFHFRSCDL